MSETTAENERIARRVPEEIATGKNLDLIEEVFAEDAVEHGPFGQEDRGHDEIRDAIGEFVDAFPDLSATVEDVVAEGDTVAMRVTLRGTHENTFKGLSPTNNTFEIQNMVFTRIEDGKGVERWLQPDTGSMLQQLGVSPEDLSVTAPPPGE